MDDIHYTKDFELVVKLDRGEVSKEDIDYIVQSTRDWNEITEDSVEERLYGDSNDYDEFEEIDEEEDEYNELEDDFDDTDYEPTEPIKPYNDTSDVGISFEVIVNRLRDSIFDTALLEVDKFYNDRMFTSVLLSNLAYSECSMDELLRIENTWGILNDASKKSILSDRSIKDKFSLCNRLSDLSNSSVQTEKNNNDEIVSLHYIKKFNIASKDLLEKLSTREGLAFLKYKDLDIRTKILSSLHLRGSKVVSPIRWNTIKEIERDIGSTVYTARYLEAIKLVQNYFSNCK